MNVRYALYGIVGVACGLGGPSLVRSCFAESDGRHYHASGGHPGVNAGEDNCCGPNGYTKKAVDSLMWYNEGTPFPYQGNVLAAFWHDLTDDNVGDWHYGDAGGWDNPNGGAGVRGY